MAEQVATRPPEITAPKLAMLAMSALAIVLMAVSRQWVTGFETEIGRGRDERQAITNRLTTVETKLEMALSNQAEMQRSVERVGEQVSGVARFLKDAELTTAARERNTRIDNSVARK